MANADREQQEQRERREPTPRKRPSVKDRQRGRASTRSSSDSSPRPRQATPRQATSRQAAPRQATPRQATPRPSASRPSSSESSPTSSAGSTAAAALSKLPIPVIVGVVVATALVVLLAFAIGGGSQTSGSESAASQEPDPGANTARANGTPYSISFATTGDIMFGREVSNYIDKNSGAAAMENVAPDLAAADVTIANLECPLTDDESEALEGKDVLWRSNPKGIESLKESDITVMSLANNHIMDYGSIGLKDTLAALDGASIKHAGAGMTEAEAEVPAEFEVNGASIAFFSWTDIIPDYFLASATEPGVVSARMNMDDACRRVREAKESHDRVIVAMHWGIEYQDYIDEEQQQDPAHKLVDAGADVVWGNHPHVIEGIEFYNGALISYSQGDFVCDHYSDKTGESFILNFDISQDGIGNVKATPVYLDDDYGIPSIVTGDRAQTILTRLEEISFGMNSSFDIQDDIAYITPAGASSETSTSGEAGSEATTSEATESEATTSSASA